MWLPSVCNWKSEYHAHSEKIHVIAEMMILHSGTYFPSPSPSNETDYMVASTQGLHQAQFPWNWLFQGPSRLHWWHIPQ
jgi:hypothetical protein